MKIGIAHYSTISDISGVTTWLIDFCKDLSRHGHLVGLHLQHSGYHPQEASIRKHLHGTGIQIFATPGSGSLRHDTLQTLRFINSFQPDIFLPQCVHAHYFAAAHAGCQGTPWILTMHSDDPDYWCLIDGLKPAHSNGTVVCVSRHLTEIAETRYGLEGPSTIPYGVNLAKKYSRQRTANEPFRVIYSGRMVEQQKCISRVVKTLMAACAMSSDVEATLLGDGPERRRCEKMVAQAGLSRRIQFLGRLDPCEVPKVLQRSHAILLMSDFEGLPLALLEAMAHGVVPVARSIKSGIPELIQHEQTGLLVQNDPKEGALALVRLSEDQSLWRKCSLNAISHIDSGYSANNSLEQWLNLINSVTDANKPFRKISCVNIRESLPFQDQRFQRYYPLWGAIRTQFSPRRNAYRLRHLLGKD